MWSNEYAKVYVPFLRLMNKQAKLLIRVYRVILVNFGGRINFVLGPGTHPFWILDFLLWWGEVGGVLMGLIVVWPTTKGVHSACIRIGCTWKDHHKPRALKERTVTEWSSPIFHTTLKKSLWCYYCFSSGVRIIQTRKYHSHISQLAIKSHDMVGTHDFVLGTSQKWLFHLNAVDRVELSQTLLQLTMDHTTIIQTCTVSFASAKNKAVKSKFVDKQASKNQYW